MFCSSEQITTTAEKQRAGQGEGEVSWAQAGMGAEQGHTQRGHRVAGRPWTDFQDFSEQEGPG